MVKCDAQMDGGAMIITPTISRNIISTTRGTTSSQQRVLYSSRLPPSSRVCVAFGHMLNELEVD